MDLASVIGLLLAVSLILGSILLGSAPFTAFVDIPSILVVLGGSMAAALMSFPLKNMLGTPQVAKNAFFNKAVSIPQLIEQIVSLADTARRDGLLALENRLDEINNSFIILGVQMAVDGTRAEVIEDIMRTEIYAVATRHRDGKSVLDQLGRFAPAYGMIGTLMGLIMMLSDMSDPSSIGAGMAVALITTLYGAIAANVLFIPFAEKLGFINKQELLAMEITLRGIMAIQSGENPRVIEQKLSTFLPPKMRAGKKEAA
jgi:chemotaxis protein MotA